MGYCIYKIVCDDLPDYVYVGSTTNFTNRKCTHKTSCNNINCKGYNYKIYSTIRDNGGWDNWRIVIINECEEGLTKTQAHIIEEEFRVKLNGNLNMVKAYRSDEEEKEYDKEYRENHKNEITEYMKEWYVKNKDIVLDRNKKYRENNKNELSEKAKEYHEKNKDVIEEKMKEKITCVCGSIFRKDALSRHIKNNKHLIFINK